MEDMLKAFRSGKPIPDTEGSFEGTENGTTMIFDVNGDGSEEYSFTYEDGILMPIEN